MGNFAELYLTDSRWNVDSHLELEHRVNALCSLVCDLLRTNQKLREAMVSAKIEIPDSQGCRYRTRQGP